MDVFRCQGPFRQVAEIEKAHVQINKNWVKTVRRIQRIICQSSIHRGPIVPETQKMQITPDHGGCRSSAALFCADPDLTSPIGFALCSRKQFDRIGARFRRNSVIDAVPHLASP
jgi:hypothetical protein